MVGAASGNLGSSLLSMMASTAPLLVSQCAASFPNAMQAHTLGNGSVGRIMFGRDARLTNPSDPFLFARRIQVQNQSTELSCTTQHCQPNNQAVAQLDPGPFDDHRSSGAGGNLSVAAGSNGILGSGSDFQFDRVVVGAGATLNLSPNHTEYRINLLDLQAGARLNLVAGDYWISDWLVAEDVELNVIGSGTARLFVENDLAIGDRTRFNSPAMGSGGDASQLLLYGYGDISSGRETTLSGILYAQGTASLGGGSVNVGAIAGAGLTLQREGLYTYDAAALGRIDWGALCPGVGSAVDHFKLQHVTSAIFCDSGGVNVTVSARDLLDDLVDDYTGSITLDTQSGRGEWSLLAGGGSFANGAADNGVATYQFVAADLGVAEFRLTYNDGTPLLPLAASVTLLVYQSDDTGIRDDASSGAIDFSPNGFTLTATALPNPPSAPIDKRIPTQVAAVDFELHIAAFGQTEEDPRCGVIESYEGIKNLNLWIERVVPVAGPRRVTLDGTPLGDGEPSATVHGIEFTRGQARLVNLNYKDVGELRIGAREGTLPIRGETEGVVVRPYELRLTRVAEAANGANLNPAPQPPTLVSPADPLFLAAGEPMALEVQSLDAEGDMTPSFGGEGEGVGFDTALLQPLGGVDPGLVSLSGAVSGGLYSGQQRWDEVGSISLQARIEDGDYLGIGTLETAAIVRSPVAVGRFVPAYYGLGSNVPVLRNGDGGWACAFTYQGQPFGFQTDPEITLTAFSRVNSITRNYGNELWKLAGTLAARTYSDEAGQGGDLQVDSSGAMVTLAGDNDLDGIGSLSISGERLSYDKRSLRPGASDIPFSARLALELAASDLTDADGTCYRGVAGAGASCEGFSLSAITGTQIRFGRLVIEPAYGPEILPVNLPVRVEQWDQVAGQYGFVTNAADGCTELSVAPAAGVYSISLSDYSGNLVSGETAPAWPGLVAGVGALNLSAPGIGNEGSVRVTLQAPPASDWLLYDWFTLGVAANPSATATFGIFRGEEPVIYRREVYR
ncbi:DUF6701 domain-containing protein [Aestuariirhabdus litorea]|uniref:DUF6701 domain-containing protein n=1 Tax=Aestuariirhabdus litorea TaxID=2528527 RepID=A0A3P3VQM3_9GAMM|nr:DUF6701 domain-containing protein [Aestuariirhabdus litorea]RRJ83123.1 hypothetical protein D0544_14900 [Aestuariirhabdus litorea]RWW93279.1 hypothetical protein DZC74_14870 [Endozoicomonadaceae bacterium GTF-13]